MSYKLQSVLYNTHYPDKGIRYRGDKGEVLEVHHNLEKLQHQVSKELFTQRLTHLYGSEASGVWRYKELVLPLDEQDIVSKREGNTNLYPVGHTEATGYRSVGEYTGIARLYLKHEGENPTGSFKDRGMTVGVSKAKSLGATAVACASTGNTSAALASYAAQAGMRAFVFIPEGKISFGKLSQAMAYGAVTLQIQGDFDTAMKLVEEVCTDMNIYLLNSVNPFRIEGQKTIAYELLQQRNWDVPDWIVLPAGNLGNTSAIGKALFELKELGFIDTLPRIASIQAEGANPFYKSYAENFQTQHAVAADTIATAIKIGNPVSYERAKHVIQRTEGVVEQVTDQEIVDAKAIVDAAGIGCEPGSATAVAGVKKLRENNIIQEDQSVVAILTGHLLKDPDTTVQYHTSKLPNIQSHYANNLQQVDSTLDAVRKIVEKKL